MKTQSDKLFAQMAILYAEQEGRALRAELKALEGAKVEAPSQLGQGLEKKVHGKIDDLKKQEKPPVWRLIVTGKAPRILAGGLAAAACLALAILLPQIFSQPQMGGTAAPMAAPAAPAPAADMPGAEPFAAARMDGGLEAFALDLEDDEMFYTQDELDEIEPVFGGGNDADELHIPQAGGGDDVAAEEVHPEGVNVDPSFEPMDIVGYNERVLERPIDPSFDQNGRPPHERWGTVWSSPDGRWGYVFTPPGGFYQTEGFFENGQYVSRYANRDFPEQYINFLLVYPPAELAVDGMISVEVDGLPVHYRIDPRGHEMILYFQRSGVIYRLESGFDLDTTLAFTEAILRG
ncbi:MAG: hypothetical protein FWE32_00640 [Oscillospiraceae bacterium]|nr:hypothetical protein [Oscillospiraceae bacterium]